MVLTKLLNKVGKENSFINELEYKRQCKFCTTIIKKIKRNFYNKLNENKITNKKTFWETMKPSFNEKTLKVEQMIQLFRKKTKLQKSFALILTVL